MTLESLPFDNQFETLGNAFYSHVDPTPSTEPHIVSANPAVCELLGLSPEIFNAPHFADYFSGNKPLPGSSPLAMLYAGHQFGRFTPQLGDGRAILLGQIRNPEQLLFDIQLKGSGETPYSRNADGRAVLRSSIREYLCSEAMHHLGIATTRALCLIGTTDEVYRENIETGAIVTRIAESHIRFGSFEVFFYREQFNQLETLADYVITHHFPRWQHDPMRYERWLSEIVQRTATLIAQWQSVGFCHGVLNTDNMSAIGLTLDYGPFGFLDAYDPQHICNHSDHHGRYAYDKQPEIGAWNLTCLAQAVLPLLSNKPDTAVEKAQACLQHYWPTFNQQYEHIFRQKFGLLNKQATDQKLIKDFLSILQAGRLDFSYSFRQLSEFVLSGIVPDYLNTPTFTSWFKRYGTRLKQETQTPQQIQQTMNAINPKYILRNHLCEHAINQAQQGDFSEVNTLLTILSKPYDDQPEFQSYADLPPEWAKDISVSCSS